MPDIQESRTDHSHPLGPMNSELKLRIPDEMSDELRRQACAMKIGTAELVRALLTRGLYGKDTFTELYSRVQNAVVSKWGDE